jgi:hypothetical protein
MPQTSDKIQIAGVHAKLHDVALAMDNVKKFAIKTAASPREAAAVATARPSMVFFILESFSVVMA